jgi:spermidine/putrescine transport system ATP-binding protein
MPLHSASALSVKIDKVRKSFGDFTVVNGIELEIQKGEFFSLLGPSGCGKTTLLRLIAGLERADSGAIQIEGKDMTSAPPQTRPVNTVFQNYALFPHLNVFENVAFGLRVKGVPKPEIHERVGRAMELVRISELGKRYPSQLSGGQKQRVALARAFINKPAVLLLDEPLAAIDAKLRKELQVELKSLQRSLGMTFIYVTHDQEEALAMSDRVAVMHGGVIEQMGAPNEIYNRPATAFAASFLGKCNMFTGTVVESGRVKNSLGIFECETGELGIGAEVLMGIRPERVRPSPADRLNAIEAKLEEKIYFGAATEYQWRSGDIKILSSAMGDEAGLRDESDIGGLSWLQFPKESLFLLKK